MLFNSLKVLCQHLGLVMKYRNNEGMEFNAVDISAVFTLHLVGKETQNNHTFFNW